MQFNNRPQHNQYQHSNWNDNNNNNNHRHQNNNTAIHHPNDAAGSLVRSAPLPYSQTPPRSNNTPNKQFQQHGPHLKNNNKINKPNLHHNQQHHNHHNHHNNQPRGSGPVRRYRDNNHDNKPYQREDSNRHGEHWQQNHQHQQQHHNQQHNHHQNYQKQQRVDPSHGPRYQPNRQSYSSSPQRQGFSNKSQFHSDKRDFQQPSFNSHQPPSHQETKGAYGIGNIAASSVSSVQKNNHFEKGGASHGQDRAWQRDRSNKGTEAFKGSVAQHGHGKQQGPGPRSHQRPPRNGNFSHSNHNNNNSGLNNAAGSGNNNNFGSNTRYPGNNGGVNPYPQSQPVMTAPHAQQQYNLPYNEGYSNSSGSSYYQTPTAAAVAATAMPYQGPATGYPNGTNNPSTANAYPAGPNYPQYQSHMPAEAAGYGANMAPYQTNADATPVSGMIGYPQPIAQAVVGVAATSGTYPSSYGSYPQQPPFGAAAAYQPAVVGNGTYPTYR